VTESLDEALFEAFRVGAFLGMRKLNIDLSF